VRGKLQQLHIPDICLTGGLGSGTWAAYYTAAEFGCGVAEIEKDCSTIEKENALKKVIYNE
jgi:hypothetical protein